MNEVTVNDEPAIGPVHVQGDCVYAADRRLVCETGFADFGHEPQTFDRRAAVARRIALALNCVQDVPSEVLEQIGRHADAPIRLALMVAAGTMLGVSLTADMPDAAFDAIEGRADAAARDLAATLSNHVHGQLVAGLTLSL